MTYGIKHVQVLNPKGIELVHKAAGDHITGYSNDVEWLNSYHRQQQEKLDRLFGDGKQAPPASTVLALTDETSSRLYGAAIVETPYYDELVGENPEQARVMASFHRVLAGMFVPREFRGEGLGRELLDWAAHHTLNQQARFLDGFVDDRTGSAGFYRKYGAVIVDHNQGLPARSPANVPLEHVKGVDGHWFYVDTWPKFEKLMRCSRCRNQLRFIADNGGRMACNTCGDPRELVDQ